MPDGDARSRGGDADAAAPRLFRPAPGAGPGFDSPEMRLVHLMRGLTVQLNLLGAEFAARNALHPTDVRALIHLLDEERGGGLVTPGLLGRVLGLNSAAVTALVDRLERLRLVRRERDTQDRRRVLLAVEPAAVDLGEAFFGALIERMTRRMRGDFDAAQLAVVERFLESMVVSVARERDIGSGSPEPSFR